MGLDKNGTRFLLYCRTLGVDFGRTAMIGRQHLSMSKRDLRGAFASFGIRVDAPRVEAILGQTFAEPLFTWLGAEEVHSFDNSGYEGATHLHDMNRELPDEFKDRYTAVLDGGSLEHVFNFPMAIKNCMEMVRVGGHYLAITPANNFLGHGFYQFSPELFFSIFTRENGFEPVRVIAREDRPDAAWYEVKSPLEAKQRVTLTNSFPVLLLVVARKTAEAPVFATMPQQSDYLALWKHEGGERPEKGTPSALAKRAAWLKSKVPAPVKGAILRVLRPPYFGFDPRFFRPIDPTEGGRETR